ncbi:MAG: HEPN domain-containing protein [Bacteroidota bacterium]|nr:HEPN domain-containing protein [Bacteroidota bacterium]
MIYDAGKNYHHALYFCQLVPEKGLKAIVVKNTNGMPPRIHNLPLLAEKAQLSLDDSTNDFLLLMSGFNIEARYPDEKLRVYKRSIKTLAKKLLKRTKAEFIWMRELALRSE